MLELAAARSVFQVAGPACVRRRICPKPHHPMKATIPQNRAMNTMLVVQILGNRYAILVPTTMVCDKTVCYVTFLTVLGVSGVCWSEECKKSRQMCERRFPPGMRCASTGRPGGRLVPETVGDRRVECLRPPRRRVCVNRKVQKNNILYFFFCGFAAWLSCAFGQQRAVFFERNRASMGVLLGPHGCFGSGRKRGVSLERRVKNSDRPNLNAGQRPSGPGWERVGL